MKLSIKVGLDVIKSVIVLGLDPSRTFSFVEMIEQSPEGDEVGSNTARSRAHEGTFPVRIAFQVVTQL